MGMRRLGTRHAPEVPNDHTNLTSTASDEHMRALVPHMRTQHAPSTGTTGWQRMDQAQTPDPYRENPGGGFPRGALATRAGSLRYVTVALAAASVLMESMLAASRQESIKRPP